MFKIKFIIYVLYMTLKGICGMILDNKKVLSAPGPKTKYFEHLFLFDKLQALMIDYHTAF